MELVYTITTGHVKCNEDICEIPFALVFYDDGIYKVETFIRDKDFFNKNKGYYFTLIGKTEKNFDIEICGLKYTLYKYENQKAELICYNYIKLSNKKRHDIEIPHTKKPYGDLLFFIEIEGMKTKFGNYTKITNDRNYETNQNNYSNEFDHTECSIDIKHPDFLENHYKLIFTKNQFNDNIIIDFTYHKGYGRLYFNNYLKIRTELLNFVSFINGGQVFVRRELTGDYYLENAKDAQIVYLYSRKQLLNYHCDDFIPINFDHSYTSSIFQDIFLKCFGKYFNLNKELDLNALVYSINNSIQTSGIEERYFILITALERICSKYSKLKNKDKHTLINKEKFDYDIKPKLIEVLHIFEKDIIKEEGKNAFNILKSKLGGINYQDDLKKSFYDFFEYAKIPINESVKKLIEEERNIAVHEGIIGQSDKERIDNYWKIDHILRDCLLNLIGYQSYRNRKIHYFNKNEMLHKEDSRA